jgi:hypothetical protein
LGHSKNSLEEEKKKIQQMKNKQQKEIEFFIQNELRIQEAKRV